MRKLFWKSFVLALSFTNAIHVEADLSWSKPEEIAQVESISPLSVDFNDNNQAAVIWSQKNKTGKMGTVSCLFSNTWSKPYNIAPYAKHDLSEPPCIALSKDKSVALWSRKGDGKTAVRARHYSNDAWSEAITLMSSPDVKDAVHLQVAISENGDGVAIWTARYATHEKLMTSLYLNGTWSDPRPMPFIFVGWTNQPFTIENSHVITNSFGDMVLIWDISDGQRTVVNAAIKKKDLPYWNSPQRLSDDKTFKASSSNAAINDRGEVIALWISEDKDRRFLEMANCLTNDGNWLRSSMFPVIDMNQVLEYKIAFNNNGNALITHLTQKTVHLG